MNKKAIVFLLVFAMVIVACGDTTEEAAVEATEEAIINAMIAAETMEGRDGNRSEAIPHRELQQILNSYGRLELSPNHRK